MQREDRYLGDGAYASFDGFQFRIYAARESDVSEVFLEPDVLKAFIDYTKECLNQQNQP